MAPISDYVNRLLRILFEPRFVDRGRGQDPRYASVEHLTASGEVRVVPRLLSMVVSVDDALAERVARAITSLMRGMSPVQMSPVQLAWLDQQTRLQSYEYGLDGITPETVSRVARVVDADPVVIGLIGSHRNGYVRAAVLEHLADVTDGREIPFLALRANDWVAPVAARAGELLMRRLRPDNRQTILATLPFIVRMFGTRRRDHHALLEALRSILLADGGDAALTLVRAGQLDTRTRRDLYDLLAAPGVITALPVITAALSDSDAVIRARALRGLAAAGNVDVDELVAILNRFLRDDSAPAIRQLALALLADHRPECMPEVLPSALLDRAARVRALARALVERYRVAIVLRDFYVERLALTAPRDLAVAIEGVGETGARTDLTLIAPFLGGTTARIRRAALRASAVLDADATIPAVIAALADKASSVRTAAAAILEQQASRVDFEAVSQRVKTLTDAHARRQLMPLLNAAPKWDAAVYLLEGLTDPSEEVRTTAATLVNVWLTNFNHRQVSPTSAQIIRVRQLLDLVGGRLSADAARLMRFCIDG